MKIKGLRAASKTIFEANKEKGFWDKPRNVGEMLMLIVTELGEAMEAHQNFDFADLPKFESLIKLDNCDTSETYSSLFKQHMKDKFEDELADTVIRLLDMCGGLNIDIEKHIEYKLHYNKTRPRLHGKKY
jgi:NTP pyrophosphatase (non-canonical NTP hydrolase)